MHNLPARTTSSATNQPRIPCPLCEKSFLLELDLTRHMRIHNDLRPFECVFCPYQARREAHLRRHTLTKHGAGDTVNDITQQQLKGLNKAQLCTLIKTGVRISAGGQPVPIPYLLMLKSRLAEASVIHNNTNS